MTDVSKGKANTVFFLKSYLTKQETVLMIQKFDFIFCSASFVRI